MLNFMQKDDYSVDDLIRIVKFLRSSEGCPWDKAQTHQSIRPNFIEETYEAVEAIDLCDSDRLKEELGDVLFQIVFHACLEEEVENFSFGDVVDEICKKLIVRHPHVFLRCSIKTESQANEIWNKIKQKTKATSAEEEVKNVSPVLPALMRAEKVQSKAAGVGYGIFSVEEAIESAKEKLIKLESLINNSKQENYSKEIGDLLFTITDIARLIYVDAECALYDSCQNYINQFLRKKLLEIQNKV